MSLPNEKIYLGKTCEFQDLCLMYPPLIGDIVDIGYDTFCSYLKIFTMTKEEVQDLYASMGVFEDIPTPFMHLLILSQIPETKKTVENSFKFFVHDSITVLYDRSEIVIGDIQEKHILNEDNYLEFQNGIRQLVGEKPEIPLDENLDPRLLKMKLKQRERDRIKEKQAAKEMTYSFATLMLSTCCLNAGITVFNINDLSYASMMKLHSFSTMKDKYETDIASMIAGADATKMNLEYWVKD